MSIFSLPFCRKLSPRKRQKRHRFDKRCRFCYSVLLGEAPDKPKVYARFNLLKKHILYYFSKIHSLSDFENVKLKSVFT